VFSHQEIIEMDEGFRGLGEGVALKVEKTYKI